MNNVRPVRQARLQNRPEGQEVPAVEPPAGEPIAVVADADVAVQRLVQDQNQGEDVPNGQRPRPRNIRGRRQAAQLSDSEPSDADDEPLPPAVVPADDEDPLLAAVRQKQKSLGYWAKNDPNITPGEAIYMAEIRQLFKSLPEVLASLVRLGGRPLNEFIVSIANLCVKFSAMKDGLVYKPNVPEATRVMIESSLSLLVDFKDKFHPLSVQPAALTSLIAYYQDGVFMTLFGRENALEAVQQFRAFSRTNRTIAACSFSSLLKWQNRSNYRAGYKKPYDRNQGNRGGGNGGSGGHSYASHDGRSGGAVRRGRM